MSEWKETSYADCIDWDMIEGILQICNRMKKVALYQPETSDLQKDLWGIVSGAKILGDNFSEKMDLKLA